MTSSGNQRFLVVGDLGKVVELYAGRPYELSSFNMIFANTRWREDLNRWFATTISGQIFQSKDGKQWDLHSENHVENAMSSSFAEDLAEFIVVTEDGEVTGRVNNQPIQLGSVRLANELMDSVYDRNQNKWFVTTEDAVFESTDSTNWTLVANWEDLPILNGLERLNRQTIGPLGAKTHVVSIDGREWSRIVLPDGMTKGYRVRFDAANSRLLMAMQSGEIFESPDAKTEFARSLHSKDIV